MNVIFVNVPKTGGELFEQNFDGSISKIKGKGGRIYSVGHSWSYPTKIKGWLDWDDVNSTLGKYNDVMSYSIPANTNIATIIRNPFDILIDYYKDDWAWCKRYQGVNTFHEFVDSYLNETTGFHVPAFKKSLFTQLKDVNGNWLINNKSFVLRYEQLNRDLSIFSKMTNLSFKSDNNFRVINYDWNDFYREDQIVKLSKLWKTDLEYLGYSVSDKLDESEKTYEVPETPKKLKVAVCFSGNLRDLHRTKDFWLDLFKNYEVDVYGSFWDDENEKLGDTIEEFKKIYNPKVVETDVYSHFKKSTLDTISPYINPPSTLLPELIEYSKKFHTLSMWYKIWKANMLTKSIDTNYDIVVRARTDAYLSNFNLVDNSMLNVPVGKIRTDNFPHSEGICDVIGFGNSNIMDYYSTTFLHLMQYLNEGYYMIPPEHFLHAHLNRANLKIRFFPSELFITRTSKGISDEVYNRGVDMIEEILPSDFMDITPNKDITWTNSIKETFKF
jgi:hypothetical protein